ncbi:hypothetical protein V8E54_008085 [Elaphomyces granulatus]
MSLQVPQENPRQDMTRRTLEKHMEDHLFALEKNKTSQQYMLFSNVPPEITEKVNKDFQASARFSYNAFTRTLIIKMVLPEHEIASIEFEHFIYDELKRMNVWKEINSCGIIKVKLGNWIKQADQCWAPPRQKPVKPFMILEVGLSQSRNQLARDAHGWLESPGTSVRLAITMNINRQRPEILITPWKPCPKPCHVVTRAASQERINLATPSEVVTITRPNNITTVSSDITLPFKAVMGREPRPHTAETDFNITKEQLKDLAERIWVELGFL